MDNLEKEIAEIKRLCESINKTMDDLVEQSRQRHEEIKKLIERMKND